MKIEIIKKGLCMFHLLSLGHILIGYIKKDSVYISNLQHEITLIQLHCTFE